MCGERPSLRLDGLTSASSQSQYLDVPWKLGSLSTAYCHWGKHEWKKGKHCFKKIRSADPQPAGFSEREILLPLGQQGCGDLSVLGLKYSFWALPFSISARKFACPAASKSTDQSHSLIIAQPAAQKCVHDEQGEVLVVPLQDAAVLLDMSHETCEFTLGLGWRNATTYP